MRRWVLTGPMPDEDDPTDPWQVLSYLTDVHSSAEDCPFEYGLTWQVVDVPDGLTCAVVRLHEGALELGLRETSS